MWTFTTGAVAATNSAGDCFHGSRQCSHKRGFESGSQRNLQRGDESADHHHRQPSKLPAPVIAVQGTVSYDAINFIATFTPTLPLARQSTYNATVTNGATDLAGIPLGTTGAPNPWTFTTGTAVVPTPIVLGPTISLFGGFGGGAGMTNQGTHTVINGDIGTTGASTTMTGFYDESVAAVAGVYPCSYTVTPSNLGLVNGTIDTAPPPPSGACPDEGTATTMAIATEAALEARTAYNTLQGLPSTGSLGRGIGQHDHLPRASTPTQAQ